MHSISTSSSPDGSRPPAIADATSVRAPEKGYTRPEGAVAGSAGATGPEPKTRVDRAKICDSFKGSMGGLLPETMEWRNMDAIRQLESDRLRTDLPDFTTGDTIAVSVRVVEGEKERIQMFQGVVLQRRGTGFSATFTVRKVSGGIGVERVFPVQSPSVAEIQVLRHGRVRRSKIFFLRDRIGKRARLRELRG